MIIDLVMWLAWFSDCLALVRRLFCFTLQCSAQWLKSHLVCCASQNSRCVCLVSAWEQVHFQEKQGSILCAAFLSAFISWPHLEKKNAVSQCTSCGEGGHEWNSHIFHCIVFFVFLPQKAFRKNVCHAEVQVTLLFSLLRFFLTQWLI